MEHDPVNHPSHYTGDDSGIECIDAIEVAFTPEEVSGFCKINAFKYLWRSGRKGDELEDLKKAQWYLDREIWTREERDQKDIKEKARKEFEAGQQRALGAISRQVYFDGEEMPSVIAVSFSTELHPSIHDWCGVEGYTSVGSAHEAPTDRPHRSSGNPRSAGSCPPPLRGASGY